MPTGLNSQISTSYRRKSARRTIEYWHQMCRAGGRRGSLNLLVIKYPLGGHLTTRGVCKLCTLEKDLHDSHFIGRVIYKKLMEPSIKNPQPVVITAKNVKQSPVQLRDDVFCSDCEQVFNWGGESWMHKHIATTTGFKLLDLFTGQKPIFNEPDLILYDAAKIPSVDCAAILEYGMGVFFKAAIHIWRFEDGSTSYIDRNGRKLCASLFIVRVRFPAT